MHRLLMILTLVFLFIITSCTSDSQKDQESQHLLITSTMGKVDAWKGDKKAQSVRKGLKIEEDWIIKTTGEDAVCMMQTPSGSVIRISGDTTLKLTELYKNNKLAIEKTGLELVAGKILVKARTLSGDDSFSVRTKTAVAGVRGTRFVVAYDEKKGTQVAVESGKVAVGQPVNVTLPVGVTNASHEIMAALERSTEVVIAPNETLIITQEDNLACQKAAETVLKETLTDGAITKPEAVKAAVVKIQAKLETSPMVLPTKRAITEADTELKTDFEAVKTLVEAAPEKETNVVHQTKKTNAGQEVKKGKPVPQPQVIPRVKEEVNPEERY